MAPSKQSAVYSPPDQLLLTRISAPQPGAVRRRRLLERLDAALAMPLTLVSAPAGFGKTTLLATWFQHIAAQRRKSGHLLRCCWLSLDSSDTDPAMFLHYFVGALQSADVQVGTAALEFLRSAQPPIPAALIPLLNDLAALPGDTVIVLDDYHLITTPAIHEVLTFVIDRLPPRVHLVLAGRGEPPCPLARLRARNQVLEVRADDLRFTVAETRAFLRGRLNPALSADDLARLTERTEGWAAGLQLAALALQDQSDPAAFVAGFNGSHRYLFDYLIEEVFERQPPDLRSTLLRTAILDRLAGALCDALLDLTPGAGAMLLNRIERNGLFLIPLDNERRWYRYHHLFAEALRERLYAAETPAAVTELYRRAAAAEPDPAHAVAYLLTAQLWPAAADRIEEHGVALLSQGRHATVRGWIEALPAELSMRRAGLCVLLGLTAVRRGEILQAEGLLTRGAALSATQAAEWHAMALAELALLALMRGEIAHAAEQIESALELPASRTQRAASLMLAIFIHTLIGRRDAVACAAAELFAELRGRPDPQLRMHVLEGALSLAIALFDQLDPLDELCRTGLGMMHGRISPARIGAEAGLAHIAWLRGRLDEALRMSEQARHTSEQFGTYAYIEPQMASIAGIAAAAHGDLEGAAREFTRGIHSAQPMALYAFSRAGRIYRLALVRWQQGRLNDVQAARASLASAPTELDAALGGLLDALPAISAGAYDEAESILRPIAAHEDTIGLMAVFGSAYPLLACIAYRRGHPAEAAAALEPLLAACARNNTPGRLLLEGPYIVPLLQIAAEHGVHPDTAASVLRLFNTHDPPPSNMTADIPPTPPRLAEPLSERELEVLRLLAAGRSNRAIAEQFVVTVGTVKRHVSNLMGKLGVESRLAAVARARELGLLTLQR